MLVLFDSVWDPYPKPGRQRDPKPHVHNSGWVQSPGAPILGDLARHDDLKPYVQDVISRFRTDRRVQVWDIFNEPENDNPAYRDVELKNKFDTSLALLKKAFVWAREMNPTQPITSAVWIGTWGDPAKLTAVERVQLEESDIITFHNYSDPEKFRQCVQNLQRYNRPILCTEYMARPNNNRFDPLLGYMKEQNVGAYNWGFVDGKTQTIYPWDSWTKKYTGEPPEWFHDILRRDGTPYRQKEVEYIKSLTRDVNGKKAERRRTMSGIYSPQTAELSLN